MSGLAELYQSVLVEHDRKPRNFRPVVAPTAEASGVNPLCGDEVRVQLVVTDGVVTDAAFQGTGCAVSRASASMMTEAVRGHSVDEVRELFRRFHALVTGQSVELASLGKLKVFAGIAEFPMRVKCATLAWHALKQALDAPRT